jgi:hypothetical protein
MNKLFALFFVVVSTVAFSQNKTEFHKVSLKDKNDKAVGFNFMSKMFMMVDSLKKISEPFKKVALIEKC